MPPVALTPSVTSPRLGSNHPVFVPAWVREMKPVLLTTTSVVVPEEIRSANAAAPLAMLESVSSCCIAAEGKLTAGVADGAGAVSIARFATVSEAEGAGDLESGTWIRNVANSNIAV